MDKSNGSSTGSMEPQDNEANDYAAVTAALSPKQLAAFHAVISGIGVVASAERAGVGRSTLHRWMDRDAHFRAALNAWKRQQVESAQSRLLGALDALVAKLISACMANYHEITLKIVQGLGVLKPPTAGGILPKVVSQEIELEDHQQQSQLEDQQQAIKDAEVERAARVIKRESKEHRLRMLKSLIEAKLEKIMKESEEPPTEPGNPRMN
jgi:hypothetical protein